MIRCLRSASSVPWVTAVLCLLLAACAGPHPRPGTLAVPAEPPVPAGVPAAAAEGGEAGPELPLAVPDLQPPEAEPAAAGLRPPEPEPEPTAVSAAPAESIGRAVVAQVEAGPSVAAVPDPAPVFAVDGRLPAVAETQDGAVLPFPEAAPVRGSGTGSGEQGATVEAAVAEVPAELPVFVVPDHPEVRELIGEFSGPQYRVLASAWDRAQVYLPMIRDVLAAEELPLELAFLPMVESHFLPHARSRADAVGLWQFIDSTARNSGLRVDWWVDERLDPESASRAAARHLRELYTRFGDWELVLAAYNAGPGGVARALDLSGTEEFWGLRRAGGLRAETSRYVPKFYAALAILEDPAGYGLAPEAEVPLPYDTVPVDSPVDLKTVSRLGRIPVAELKDLNPALLRGCTPPGAAEYALRVPRGRGPDIAAKLDAVPPRDRLSFRRHRIGPGDTLWAMARRYGTRAGAIAELNEIRDPRALRPGRELVIPIPAAGGGPATAVNRTVRQADTGSGWRLHTVESGDTLWGLARRFGVTVDILARWNGLGGRGILRPGDRLRVGVGGGGAVGEGEGPVHVVQEGDTLWGISRRYGVPVPDLLRRNSLGVDAILLPGDRVALGRPEGDQT